LQTYSMYSASLNTCLPNMKPHTLVHVCLYSNGNPSTPAG
jgi:hypothetical protein